MQAKDWIGLAIQALAVGGLIWFRPWQMVGMESWSQVVPRAGSV
jgi:hypothetical protein